jgi:hypothetical protein
MVGVTPDFCQQLDADHVGLVRYEDEFQAPYITVRDRLHLRAKEAPEKIAETFRIGEWGEAEQCKTKRIMDSLKFLDMDLRQQAISEAAFQTCEWMLPEDAGSPEQDQECPPCRLSEWLANRDGVFWVCGKAGSGKSTLMKFVQQNNKTLDLLKTWASGSPLVIAEHHFWYPGQPLQKSYEGFARTLLKKILEADPTIAKWAFPGQLAKELSVLGTNISQRDLHQALLDLNKAGVKICLFVDGLDECHPHTDQESVKSTICELAKLDNIKLCVSSREWQIFEETFQSPNMLRLEDINRKDIQAYVSNAIQNSIINRNEVSNNDKCFADSVRGLEFEIVERSAGVFLWVHIVTRIVAERLRIGQDVEIVLQYVDKFPGDLEDYFRDMIYKRVSPTWREETTTAQALKLAMLLTEATPPQKSAMTLRPHTPYLVSWWFLARSSGGFEDKNFGFSFPFTILTSSVLKGMLELTRNFLKSSCQDLLQVIDDIYGEEDESSFSLWFHESKVTFASRTVYDFLLSREMNDLINRKTPTHLQQPFLIQIDIAQAKLILPYHDWPLIEGPPGNHHPVLDNALARVREPDFDPAMKIAVVVECHKIALRYVKHAKSFYGRGFDPYGRGVPSWISTSESYLVSEFLFHGYDEFLNEKLKYPDSVTYSDFSSSLGEGYVSELDFPIRRIDVRIIRSFLSNGLSPNGRREPMNCRFANLVSHEMRSVWGGFLAKCFEEAWGSSERQTLNMRKPGVGGVEKLEDLPKGQQFRGPYRFPTEDANHAWIIAKCLLRRDANLNESICVLKGRCRPETFAKLIFSTHDCQRLTALDILRAIVRKDQQAELRGMVEKRGMKWPENSTVEIKVTAPLCMGDSPEPRQFSYTLSIDK